MERPNPQLGTHTQTTGGRILALFADSMIIFVLAVVVGVVLGDFWAFFLVGAVGSIVYHTYLEGTYGQTIGKRAVNIVVVKENGDPCDMESAAIRNVARVIDSFMFYLLGLLVILITDDNQRIGDLVGDTVVTRVASDDDPDPEPEPTPEPKPTRSAYTIKLHGTDDSADRYVELVNETESDVELAGGTLRTASGFRFQFPQEESVHRPGNSKTFHIPAEFAIEEGDTVTLVTRNGNRYDAGWDEK